MRIRQVEIGKRRWNVCFNMAAWHDIEKETGMSPANVFDENRIEPSNMLRLMYLGLKYGADASHQRFDMTYSAFIDLIESDPAGAEVLTKYINDDVVEIIKILNERYRMSNPEAETAEKKSKKQPGRTTSGASEG